MSDKQVVEVYRAKNGAEAHRFVMALDEAGIKAEIQGKIFHPAAATADSLISENSAWWDAPRILVFEEDAESAKRILLELEERARHDAREAETSAPIDVTCEDCGNSFAFPSNQRGTVQVCPQCGAYLDVGDEDLPDGWDEGEKETP